MKNAMLINEKDNVLVAIELLTAGTAVELGNGEMTGIVTTEEIPMYHKIARTELKKGEQIIKYGEYIGVAETDIPAGSHVHTHNVLSARIKMVD